MTKEGAVLLYTNSASPFGRKVKVFAIETGLFERIEISSQQLTPVAPNAAVNAANPLGKIPCLVTDDGIAIYDSRVICEYLDALHDGTSLFPAGPERWRALTLQALGDGILEAGVSTRYETFVRPEGQRWADWVAGQKAKIARALDRLETAIDSLPDRLHIGAITIGCALGYLDFRFAADSWRDRRPRLAAWYEAIAARESFRRTEPT
jgi:glutathione S-transferase